MRKHVLILANGFINDAPRALPTELLTFADPASEMHVLAPVHLTRLQSVCSDLDPPRAEAHERLDRILRDMTSLGLSATGEIADENQLLAIEDALAQSNAHAIVVVTHAPGQQNWRERQLMANVARFQLPVKDVLITRDGSIATPSSREPWMTPNGTTRGASSHTGTDDARGRFVTTSGHSAYSPTGSLS